MKLMAVNGSADIGRDKAVLTMDCGGRIRSYRAISH